MNRAERITRSVAVLGGSLLALSACDSESPPAIDAAAPSIDAAVPVDAPVVDANVPSDAAAVITVSCAEFLQLTAGLSYHLTQGTCTGDICTWDYDPAGEEITRINGEFDASAGTFSWQESYHSSHWRVATAVSGTGQIQVDGSEISSFTVTTTDILGVDRVVTVEQERVGCALTRTTTDADGQTFTLQGTFAETFTYTETQIPRLWNHGAVPAEANGQRTDLGIVHETFAPTPEEDWFWQYYHTLLSDADGNTTVDFYMGVIKFKWARWGQCSWDIAGTETCSIEYDEPDWRADLNWIVDYAGDGSGVLSAAFYDSQSGDWFGQDCPITFSSWACTINCPSGHEPHCEDVLINE